MGEYDRKGWRTLRVVVELPVRGSYTSKDLSWDVRRCLDQQLDAVLRTSRASGAKFGVHRTKEYERVVRADKKEPVIS